jgi:hypothetical protein
MTIYLPTKRAHLFFAAITLAISSLSQAQIYKWVDANGRTHYSESQPTTGAGANNVKSLRIDASPVAVPSNNTVAANKFNPQALLVQAKATEGQAAAPAPITQRPLLTNPPNTVESNATLCARARDLLPRIKAGTVKHHLWNGAITKVDDNDRVTAENDIANFCR